MKKSFIIVASIFLLLLSNPIFAQENPGDDPDAPPVPGNLAHPGTDPDLVPINHYLCFLVVVAVVYAFYKFRELNLQKT